MRDRRVVFKLSKRTARFSWQEMKKKGENENERRQSVEDVLYIVLRRATQCFFVSTGGSHN